MGGSAFARASAPNGEPTLFTPRMTPEEYSLLKTLWKSKLQTYLGDTFGGIVGCAREVPEKSDYGDIDLFVALELPTAVDFVKLARDLGAKGVIVHGPQKCSLAVRRDGYEREEDEGGSKTTETVVYCPIHGDSVANAPVSTEAYAHIDLECIPRDVSEWWMFSMSYGGMAGLLGQIVKGLGFSLNDRGLRLRMAELDRSRSIPSGPNIADKDGMIFLSCDPDDVMKFLGLSVEDYHGGFETVEHLYRWLGECRLLIADTTVLRAQPNNLLERQTAKRSVYQAFFKEWLPAFLDIKGIDVDLEQRAKKIDHLRAKYAEEAVLFFNCKSEYEEKQTFLVRTIDNAAVTVALRPLIERASGRSKQKLTEMMRAFRRQVGCTSTGEPYLLGIPHQDADTELYKFLGEDGGSLREVNRLESWVYENWATVLNAERQRGKSSSRDRQTGSTTAQVDE